MMRALFAGRVSYGYRPLPCCKGATAYRVPKTSSIITRHASTISSADVSSLESGHIELGENEGLVFVNSELFQTWKAGPINLTSFRYLPPKAPMAAAIGTTQRYPVVRKGFKAH